jgi:hypothetical protein
MPTYRRLTQEELKHFESEFIDFLVVNGIVSDSWQQMKMDNLKDANEVIDLFSDVIFEKVMRKSHYLEQRLNNQLFCFYFGDEKAELMLVTFDDNINVSEVNFDEMILKMNDGSGLTKINYQTKAYTNKREKEMFDLIESGCEVTQGDIFKKLKAYYLKQSN